jgi:hypothetical protein
MAALLLAAIGLVALFRVAAAATGQAVALMALAAFAAGQVLLVRPTLPEALVFTGAALALEAHRLLGASWPRTALAILAVPAIVVALLRPGLPAPAEIADVLFCSRHGALASSAVLWLGAAGLVWGAIADPRRAGLWAASFGVTVAAIAGGHDPAATWRDSAGAFAAALPHAALGLAWLAARIRSVAASRPAWAAALLLAPLVFWNITLMAVAQAGTLRIGEAVSFGTIGAAQARVVHGWIGHALSMPASLAFTLRYGTSPALFDALGAADADPTRPVSIDVGAGDDAFAGAGWFAPERAGDLSFRWAGQRAELMLPPLAAGRVRVRLHLYAFTYEGAAPQQLHVQIANAVGGPAIVGPDWGWVDVELDLPRPTPPATPLTLTFSRATPPSAVQGSQDRRPLSAAVDLVEVVPVR